MLEEWLTGAYAGYTVDCLRESEGMLWVGESEHENDKMFWDYLESEELINLAQGMIPTPILHCFLCNLICKLNLMRAKLNETTAWEYALSRDGKPYEYHNMTSSWIDTTPGCSSVMGSQHHMYCVPFVLEMYKEAGLFDPIASSIRATEFTIKDAYLVRFFENNSSRLPKWCNDADTVKLPNCQIWGKYRLELPVYNVVDPYPNMNERYPSMPSRYSRIANC
ncbi:hypothetical protein WN944_001172 [Citrus x changshan-huyou]|uniref:Uncharacterized protein n=1 Tax=Citrus x changshan-huyou TaxID=2935761 RepID=A0AAP0QQH0_9ROSI